MRDLAAVRPANGETGIHFVNKEDPHQTCAADVSSLMGCVSYGLRRFFGA